MNPRARTAKNKSRLKNYDKMLETRGRGEGRLASSCTSPPAAVSVTSCCASRRCTSRTTASATCSSTLTFDLQPGDIFGVVGPNGTGKTTMLKMITGKLEPDSGTVTDR